MNPEQMSLLRGQRYNRTKKEHGGQIPGTRIGQNVPSSTAGVLAQQYGVDERTIKRDGQFAQAVDTLGGLCNRTMTEFYNNSGKRESAFSALNLLDSSNFSSSTSLLRPSSIALISATTSTKMYGPLIPRCLSARSISPATPYLVPGVIPAPMNIVAVAFIRGRYWCVSPQRNVHIVSASTGWARRSSRRILFVSPSRQTPSSKRGRSCPRTPNSPFRMPPRNSMVFIHPTATKKGASSEQRLRSFIWKSKIWPRFSKKSRFGYMRSNAFMAFPSRPKSTPSCKGSDSSEDRQLGELKGTCLAYLCKRRAISLRSFIVASIFNMLPTIYPIKSICIHRTTSGSISSPSGPYDLNITHMPPVAQPLFLYEFNGVEV